MSVELNTVAPKKWSGNYSGSAPTLDSSNGVNVGDLAIDTSTTPYRVWTCEKNTLGSPVWVDTYEIVKTMFSTGTLTGGILSVNADTTKFDVAAGVGYIVDNHTDPTQPVVTRVSWTTKTAQTTPYRTTNPRTEVMIDSSGNLHLATAVTSDDYRDYIYLGKIVHNDLSTISSTSNLQHAIFNTEIQSLDISTALGSINVSGNVFSANGANLNLNRSSGSTYRMGSNYANSKKTPNIYVSSSGTALQFRYRYRNGSGGFTTTALTSSVNPNNWDDGSATLATTDNNKWTIQRIYYYAGTGNVYITYGQTQYSTLTDARSGIATEEPVIDPVTAAEASLRCYMVVKQGSTVLNSIANAYFKAAGKLGEPIGGGAAGGDVVGPTSATNSGLARFDGTTGKLLKDAVGVVDDSGNMTGIATIVTTGDVTVGGSVRSPVATVTAGTTTVLATHGVILANAAAGTITLNLPTAVGITGKTYNIKKTDSSENAVSVVPNGTEKIDGRSSQDIYSQYVSMTIVSNGANWFII